MKKLYTLLLLFLSTFCFSQYENDSLFFIMKNKDLEVYKELNNLSSYTRLQNRLYINPDDEYTLLVYDIKKSEKDLINKNGYYIYGVYGKTPVYIQSKDVNIFRKGSEEPILISDFHTFITNSTTEYKNAIKDLAVDLSDYQKGREIKKVLDYFDSFKNKRIGVITARPFENYSFTGAEFKIINFSPKTIKYITFKYHGLNAVDDKVYLGKNLLTVTSKGIGPIEYLETGSWEFEYAWSTDIVETMVLKTMEIIYMDGSKAIINMNDNLYFDEVYIDKLSKISEES